MNNKRDIVNKGLSNMFYKGVIMDVTNKEEALVAERAGAVSVMALEKVPVDIIRDGGIARMASVNKIKEIQDSVSIPVMAKVRIGHYTEAEILQNLSIDFIDESEVLTPASDKYIDKELFNVPFVNGVNNIHDAIYHIANGSSMVRIKGKAGTGNVYNAVKSMQNINDGIKIISELNDNELGEYSMKYHLDYSICSYIKENKKLPIILFSAGGIATVADGVMMMKLGADGIFVGSGIFKSSDPYKLASSIVEAVSVYNDINITTKNSRNNIKYMN